MVSCSPNSSNISLMRMLLRWGRQCVSRAAQLSQIVERGLCVQSDVCSDSFSFLGILYWQYCSQRAFREIELGWGLPFVGVDFLLRSAYASWVSKMLTSGIQKSLLSQWMSEEPPWTILVMAEDERIFESSHLTMFQSFHITSKTQFFPSLSVSSPFFRSGVDI